MPKYTPSRLRCTCCPKQTRTSKQHPHAACVHQAFTRNARGEKFLTCVRIQTVCGALLLRIQTHPDALTGPDWEARRWVLAT